MFDSGCSRHITGNKALLYDYEEIDGGFVAFGGSTKGGKIIGDLTCLFAKATTDESNLWHRRLGHVNFKTMNKLVKGNLVRGLPSKTFENDHPCVACLKGKQHKASCNIKLVSSISQPLHMLHMDLFGLTSIRSINHKTYCLVVTDDFSRFSWVFFLAHKNETSGILKKFITEVENQVNHKVKVIRSDNGTEFKNKEMDEFCGQKGIKKEYSVARTPQQNGAEVVNTACYVLNRVLVTKPHNKTPYELIIGKFDGKAEEGFLVGYSVHSKAFRNVSTQQYIVFPLWSSISSSYKSTNDKEGDDTAVNAAGNKDVQEPASENDQALKDALDRMMNQEKEATEQSDVIRKDLEAQSNIHLLQEKVTRGNTTNNFNTISTSVYTANLFKDVSTASASRIFSPPYDPLMPELEDTAEMQTTGIFGNAYDDDLEHNNTSSANESVGAEADFNNMEPSTVVSPIPITKIHYIHPKAQIIGDLMSPVQTRGKIKKSYGEHAMIRYI
ncbi:putative ribonuclease H-like domain-containing protein [Tanacetum coccineum]